jgi:hypothetical protein
MEDKAKEQILKATLLCLKPLARILIQCGIGLREFSEVSKTAFVEVATNEYGLRGRPTNMSRVALMTGLTRKEVRRIRESAADGNSDFRIKTAPITRVLHKWASESEFTGPDGAPADLPFEGKTGSFKSLVKQHAGDIPPGAVKTELIRVGSIEEVASGHLRLMKRSFRPGDLDQRVMTTLIRGVYPSLMNAAHNLDPKTGDNSWPQYTAFAKSIRKEDLPRLRRVSKDRFVDFVQSFDDMFMAYESLHATKGDKDEHNPIVVELIYFEEEDDAARDLW